MISSLSTPNDWTMAVHIAELLSPGDTRSNSPEAAEAKRKNFFGLMC